MRYDAATRTDTVRPVVLILGALGAFACYTVGGLVGFASSLLYLPVLLVLGVPLSQAVALNLVMAVLTRLPSVVVLRDHLDLRRTTAMLAGSVPGIAAGLVVARLVPAGVLEVGAGLVVLASGLHLVRGRRRPATAPSGAGTGAALVAGGCSGVLGVTTSLNGIPPAVLLARSGATVRARLADLSAFFVVGNCLTLAALAVVADVPVVEPSSETAAWLLVGMVGNAVGLRLAELIDQRRFDDLTIGLVLLSGTASLVGAVT